MIGAKLHRITENGFTREVFICSKCKKEVEELKGIKTKEGTEHISPRYKWVCNSCFYS